ncbi:B-cell receptor CD22 [Scomber scombrus]|uniref:B-cell receptor CD22 n=1 Tax=Scomber scombrus TaxID=13677 RepID=A0AAV1P1Y6_SCOSC
MKAQTVGWLIVLALIKKFSCGTRDNPFQLQNKVEAKEGSCIEIKCNITRNLEIGSSVYWFWMKNANWNGTDFNGTVIYSSNIQKRPVSAEYAGRVEYIGSSSWTLRPKTQCSILINNLTKMDSGNYSLRYVGKLQNKWFTKTGTNLTVHENPCPIIFEKPPTVKENETVTLTCSTLNSCPSNPQIEGLTHLPTKSITPTESIKSTMVSFTANWMDDGKEFSCQTHDKPDRCMVRNISVVVEYAPKDTSAMVSPKSITEGQTVTFTCSAKGRPDPTYTWFKKARAQVQQMEMGKDIWEISSITASQSGEYYCEAQNEHGETRSNPVLIDVTYAPNVMIEMTPHGPPIRQGLEMTLNCSVKSSNPQPSSYAWFKDGACIKKEQTYYVPWIKPEDSGNYSCEANNTAGSGRSETFLIEVEYRPRKTDILIPGSVKTNRQSVKVGRSLTVICNTEANPAPNKYSWYRYSENKWTDSLQWTSNTTSNNRLYFESVKRADEACYSCNATNIIGTGDNSESLWIQVLYPPTNVMLTMDTEVRSGEFITISCTVESFPPSSLTLTRTSTSSARSSEWHMTKSANDGHKNIFSHGFNVTSAHAGFYTCYANNSIGEQRSTQRKLVVKYIPQNVTIKAQPGLEVIENQTLTLDCSAHSQPPVTSVTWMKVIDGKDVVVKRIQSFTLKSVTPSDSGSYSCTATNELGSGKSQPVYVHVKYAPKHTTVTRGAVQQLEDGMHAVTLSCSSLSYPKAERYVWYMEKDDYPGYIKVSYHQNYTVNSDKPGVYYCTAENEIDKRMSDPVELFLNRRLTKILIFVLFFILIIIALVFIIRSRRKQSIQQGTSNRRSGWTRFSFLAWWNDNIRRNLTSEPKTQPCQPPPDRTAASNINTVYCTLNLPAKQVSQVVQSKLHNTHIKKTVSEGCL